MTKKTSIFLSILLCLSLFVSMAVPVYAEKGETSKPVELSILSVDSFLRFAENCRLDTYSKNLNVTLKTDLDLSGIEFHGVPIFCGSFDGKGHTISGLTIGGDGSALGLFRYLTDTAVVHNLKIAGSIAPEGSRSMLGGIAGQNSGRISSCSFTGTVHGSDYIGGIAGINTVQGIIENCHAEGLVNGIHFVGGIAGDNLGVIRSCINLADINITSQQNLVGLSDISLESLTESESANTVTNVGGIAGNSSGVIRSCKNLNVIGYRHMGYNIGGIAGSQSGYVVDCSNMAEIYGRKEVGGIVGQLEPVALVEYEEDALQILQGQLDGMSSITSQTAVSVQAGAQEIGGQVSILQGHIQNAQDALGTLLPGEGEIPDPDSFQAAQNTLSSSLAGMTNALQDMSATTQTAFGAITNNLYALQNQLNAMRATLDNVSETVGGSIEDVSDADTDEDLTGKVENCVNYSPVLADMNVGGIVGAISPENDADTREDLNFMGENSLNFESQLRAVIVKCSNQASVTGRRQNAGGIVGLQSLGLVKNSINTGHVDAPSASYVGGISGQSTGFIRNNSSNCLVSGSSYVGGIAGSASIVSDCLSLSRLEDIREKFGAIIGFPEENNVEEEEEPIRGNLYASVDKDIGAIDGISYSGMAEPLNISHFLEIPQLPDSFRHADLCFVYSDGREEVISLTPGSSLAMEDIPAVPEIAGCIGVWEGLEDADLSDIRFDMRFEAVYNERNSTLESKELSYNGRPLMLVQGSFAPEAAVSLSPSDLVPDMRSTWNLVECWAIDLEMCDNIVSGRLLAPNDKKPQFLHLILRDADGSWTEVPFAVDGSYLYFETDGSVTEIALAESMDTMWVWLGAGLVSLICALWVFLLRRRKTQSTVKES